MLKIDLEPGESVRIGDYAVVTLEAKTGQRARIAFQADRSIPIERLQQHSSESSRLAADYGITGERKR